MRKLSFLFVLTFLISLSFYSELKSEEKISLTVLDFSDTVKKDVPLRDSIITTLRRYSFIKYIPLIEADRLKIKEPFKTDTNYSQNASAIGKILKANYIIYIDKEITTNFITNNIQTNNFDTDNVVEDIATNDMETFITDTGVQTIDTAPKETTDSGEENKNTQETLGEVEVKEEIKETFKMYALDTETGNIIKEKAGQKKEEINNFTREVIDTLGVYYANNVFKKLSEIENPSIKLDFSIDAFSYINEKTRTVENGGNVYFGDTVTFNFKSNRDGYIYIIVFQSDGNVILIYPNDFVENIKTEADTLYKVPKENSLYQISILPQNGIDNYYILYTKDNIKINYQNSYMSGTGFKILNKTSLVDFAKYVQKKLKYAKKNSYKMINYKTSYSEYFDETFFQEVEELK